MNLKQIHSYYSREDVKDFLLNLGKNREVTGVFKSGNYSQRPNVIVYPQDITAMVKTGVMEFHCSLERWSQPMSLRPDNYNKLRTGWDLILDIDCKLFEHGKIASQAFIWAIKKHDVKSFSVKYTGGTGFHIGIPWEAIPKEVDYKSSVKQYPDLARKIVMYLKDFVYDRLEKDLLKEYSPEDLAKQVNKPLGKILTDEGLNPYQVVDVDPVLISPRHLFRMPYSLNKKTFLVSLPIKPSDLEDFERMEAKPETVKVGEGFLDKFEPNGAELLVAESVDWWVKMRREIETKMKKVTEIKRKIHEDFFPPCIKNISAGLSDGKKRSVFILLNFLRSSKWSWDEIEQYLIKWNRKNKPPLRDSYIRGQIRYQRSRKSVLPPNCFHPGWYSDFGVCKPDNICEKLKNPVNYAQRKMRIRRKR